MYAYDSLVFTALLCPRFHHAQGAYWGGRFAKTVEENKKKKKIK